MPLFKLINPSDDYTLRADSIEIAGAAVAYLSQSYGVENLDTGETSPVMFGWNKWFRERGISADWFRVHLTELADCLDSFLIGNAVDRELIEEVLERLPESERKDFIMKRQERRRTSMSQIGEAAYNLASHLRAHAAEQANAESSTNA